MNVNAIREDMREYLVSKNYDDWWSIECRTPEILGKVFKMFMEFKQTLPEARYATCDYDVANDVFWVRGQEE